MLKRTITYTDFNDKEVTEDFYFHLTQAELLEMQVEYKEGLDEALKKIVQSEDTKEIIQQFKKIVLTAYGIKSEDGRGFEKSDAIRKSFASCAAYSELFMELATDDKKAAIFIKGIMPKQLAEEIEKEELQAKVAANLTKVPDIPDDAEVATPTPPSA